MKYYRFVVFLLLLCVSPHTLFGEVQLYGARGVTPQAVRQGDLGSCYFHASIASLAAVQPELLRAAIQQDGKGLKVRFANGEAENVYLQDVQFARDSGYDRSDGLWVAVLFRGYAQRTLRRAMLEAIDKSALSSPVKLAASFLAQGDFVLLAYDRAIRAEIDQQGTVDRTRLKIRLQKELQSVPVSDEWKNRALDLLDTNGYFQSLEEQVKANGELFGAYRAVGQGGMPAAVLRAFAGDSHSFSPIKNSQQAANEISNALSQQRAVVAWTNDDAPVQALITKWRSLLAKQPENWFVPLHAYSVLAIDTRAGTVKLRNPWMHQPDPDGEFTLPLDLFSSIYLGFSISAPASHNASSR